MITLNTVLLNVLQAVLIAAVPLLLKYLVVFLTAKAKEVQDKTDNENLKSIIENVNKLVGEVVSFVGQTYVDNLKEGGEFNLEEQKTALAMAYERTLSMIDSKSEEVIKATFGDIDTYILTLIENATDKRNDAKRATDTGMY